MNDIEPLFINLRDGLKVIGIGETKGRQLIRAGRIKMVKVGRKSLLDVASLKAFAASLTDGAKHE
jgi:hypothetical protein